MVVINLSNNDYIQPETFAKNLHAFVQINRTAGIKTVFVLESNAATDYGDLNHETWSIMRSVAEKQNIPLLDAHTFMKSKINDGILWWDSVHLTDYGYQVEGTYIAEQLLKLL
jgi:Lysophospholipase L1 and related esterases